MRLLTVTVVIFFFVLGKIKMASAELPIFLSNGEKKEKKIKGSVPALDAFVKSCCLTASVL